jgi:hypothetical protein
VTWAELVAFLATFYPSFASFAPTTTLGDSDAAGNTGAAISGKGCESDVDFRM